MQCFLCRSGRSTRNAIRQTRASATWTSCRAWPPSSSPSSMDSPDCVSVPTSWRSTTRSLRLARRRSSWWICIISAQTWRLPWRKMWPQLKWLLRACANQSRWYFNVTYPKQWRKVSLQVLLTYCVTAARLISWLIYKLVNISVHYRIFLFGLWCHCHWL